MANAQPFASASLYVGDLVPEVTEAALYDVFNAIGPVSSIRVCRDSVSRRSLGYAYVNYHAVSDAERALDTLNYSAIKGHACRIMWSHRDPSLRKSGTGNIFVKNLDKNIDNKALYDTFSLFGNILSCKVATDNEGKSLGYGFVHYEGEEAAKTAIERVNGMLIGNKVVYVGPFVKRQERSNPINETFTNLYIKGIPSEWTEETLKEVFSKFGEVTSAVLKKDKKDRVFGFVNYEDVESARKAVDELHERVPNEKGVMTPEEEMVYEEELKKTKEEKEKQMKEKKEKKEEGDEEKKDETGEKKEEANGEDKKEKEKKDDDDDDESDDDDDATPGRLYVGRAQTKAERQAALKEQFEGQEKEKKFAGVNLYIKNLDDSIDDDKLREIFEPFGTITSAKVMTDDNSRSKGFGFVCFVSPDEATKAVTEMHLKLMHGKPLYVGLAERRDQRIQRLQQRYRLPNMARGPGGPNPMGGVPGGAGGMGNQMNSQMFPGGMQGPQMFYPNAHPMQAPRGGNMQQMFGAGGMVGGNWRGPGVPPQVRPNMVGGMGGGAAGQQGHMGPVNMNMNVRPMMNAGASMLPMGPNMGGFVGGPGGQNPGNFQGAARPRGANMGGVRGNFPQGNMGMGGPHQGQKGGQQSNQGQNFRFTAQARNQSQRPEQNMMNVMGGGNMNGMNPAMGPQLVPNQHVNPQMPMPHSDSEAPLTAAALAAAPVTLQKQMLGEKLFPLIAKHQPELAGKITGMMLEMDNSELLILLESENNLRAKVDEALRVLQAAREQTTA